MTPNKSAEAGVTLPDDHIVNQVTDHHAAKRRALGARLR